MKPRKLVEPVKVSRRVLLALVSAGAEDISDKREPLDEPTSKALYSVGSYGITGAALVGQNTGKIYVVTDRSGAIYQFL